MHSYIKFLVCFFLITVSATPQYVSLFADIPYNSVKTQKSSSKVSTTVFKPSEYSHGGYDQAIKVTMNYDQSGNLIEQLLEELSLRRDKDRSSYLYYRNGKLKTQIRERWNIDSWVNNMRWSYEYHSLDNKVVETFDLWKNDSWVTSEIRTTDYDIYGNLLVFRMDVVTNGKVEPEYRVNKTYNSNSKILSDESYYWSDDAWKNSYRSTYSYDSGDRLISLIYEKGSGSAWKNVSRQIHEYDEAGNQKSTVASNWSGTKWVNDTRTERKFNSTGNMVSEILSKWTNGQFVQDNKTEFIYTSPFQLDSIKEYSLENQIWKEDRRRVYKFDGFGNTISGDSYYLTTEGWRGTLSSLEFWYNGHSENMKFVAASANMQYIQVNTATSPGTNPETFTLSQNYPNPFSTSSLSGNSETTIRFLLPKPGYVKGAVYDALGKEVVVLVEKEIPAGEHQLKFDAKGLAAGVYFFRLEAGQNSSNIKMILTK